VFWLTKLSGYVDMNIITARLHAVIARKHIACYAYSIVTNSFHGSVHSEVEGGNYLNKHRQFYRGLKGAQVPLVEFKNLGGKVVV